MISYNIIISKKAMKFIQKQTPQNVNKLLTAIKNLPNGNIKPYKSEKDFFRLKVGDFRVIYQKNDNEFIIYVAKVGNRGDVYKG